MTFKEMLCRPMNVPLEHEANLEIVLDRINELEKRYGKKLVSTNSYRTKEHHIEIYKSLAKQRGHEFDLAKVPMGSRHLTGEAVDIADHDGKLFDWCKVNFTVLEELKLWCEEKDDQPRVHFQIVPPPKSGNRFFKA